MNKESHFWSTSIIGIVLDFSIWVLPIPVVGKLRLPKRQKISLTAVFNLGGLWVSSSTRARNLLTNFNLSVCIITLLGLVLVHGAVNDGEVTSMALR
jgi:hypothetical protein